MVSQHVDGELVAAAYLKFDGVDGESLELEEECVLSLAEQAKMARFEAAIGAYLERNPGQ